ncbi:PREDICTED: putative zinc finger protein 286B [Rhagoletis zephyria]|uniref:putative zinc finger protein 286B n=1 Tax=Rhagoletis zephyria TaxID=28612 RepID=UPI000811A538|nr:PREDICTED: putative zinc finger protein 286B [Rhagoletis zephyria]
METNNSGPANTKSTLTVSDSDVVAAAVIVAKHHSNTGATEQPLATSVMFDSNTIRYPLPKHYTNSAVNKTLERHPKTAHGLEKLGSAATEQTGQSGSGVEVSTTIENTGDKTANHPIFQNQPQQQLSSSNASQLTITTNGSKKNSPKNSYHHQQNISCNDKFPSAQKLKKHQENEKHSLDTVKSTVFDVAQEFESLMTDLKEVEKSVRSKPRERILYFCCPECPHLSPDKQSYSEHQKKHLQDQKQALQVKAAQEQAKNLQLDQLQLHQMDEGNGGNNSSKTRENNQSDDGFVVESQKSDQEMEMATAQKTKNQPICIVSNVMFPCPQCSLVFTDSKICKMHIFNHKNLQITPKCTEERPYFCSPCKMTFNSSSSFYLHQRSVKHLKMISK